MIARTSLVPLARQLTRQRWDAMAGPHFYSTSAWLDFCAARFGTPGEAAFGCAGGHPVLAVPIAEPVAPHCDWNTLLADRGLPALPACGVLVGPRDGGQTHLLRDHLAGQQEAAADLVGSLRALAARGAFPDRRGCVAMYLTSADVALLRTVGVRAHPVLLHPDAWIAVPEGGWFSWLDTLPSKRRVRIRAEVQRFRDGGWKLEDGTLEDCVEQVAPLMARCSHRYGAAGAQAQQAMLRRHAACLGDRARVVLCSGQDGEPVGFCLYHRWWDRVFLYSAGVDQARVSHPAVFYTVTYYSHIESAPGTGIRWVHAGSGCTLAAGLRGAELRPLWLLDLAERSPLAIEADRVKAHNRAHYERLRQDPRTARAVTAHDEWEAFL